MTGAVRIYRGPALPIGSLRNFFIISNKNHHRFSFPFYFFKERTNQTQMPPALFLTGTNQGKED